MPGRARGSRGSSPGAPCGGGAVVGLKGGGGGAEASPERRGGAGRADPAPPPAPAAAAPALCCLLWQLRAVAQPKPPRSRCRARRSQEHCPHFSATRPTVSAAGSRPAVEARPGAPPTYTGEPPVQLPRRARRHPGPREVEKTSRLPRGDGGRRALGGAALAVAALGARKQDPAGAGCALRRGGVTRPPCRGGRGTPGPPSAGGPRDAQGDPAPTRRANPGGSGRWAGAEDLPALLRDAPRGFPSQPSREEDAPRAQFRPPPADPGRTPCFPQVPPDVWVGPKKIHPHQVSKLPQNRAPTNERSTPTELGGLRFSRGASGRGGTGGRGERGCH